METAINDSCIVQFLYPKSYDGTGAYPGGGGGGGGRARNIFSDLEICMSQT